MFDLRYHVASLAAVFIALIIGILVGVGLAGSGVTKDAELKSAKLQNAELTAKLDQANAQIDSLKRTQKAFQLSYPALIANRLTGKRVAVLFIGRVDAKIYSAIQRTLEDAGAQPTPLRLRAISVPINSQAIDTALFDARPAFVKYVGDDKLGLLGKALAAEFTLGVDTPLWTLLSSKLVEEARGSTKQRADAVIVVRTVKPQQGVTARFLAGLVRGLAVGGTAVVGVEDAATQISAVPAFTKYGFSTVDDVDQLVGQLALALLLNGGMPGHFHYGVKDGATAVLPPIVPAAPVTPGG
jgi:hypothetical protein